VKAVALLLALWLPPRPHHPCLTLAAQCRARVARCDAGAGWASCSSARACIARYEARCGLWWSAL